MASCQPNTKLSLGGLLPTADLAQTLYPGLNLVASPQLRTQPLTVWDWNNKGVAGTSQTLSDVLYAPDNQPHAWLNGLSGTPTWTGVTTAGQPGELEAALTDFQNI